MITPNLSWEQYRQIKKMNPSTMVHGHTRSMKRLKRAIDGKIEYKSEPVFIGIGVHALLLEPEAFEASYVVMPDFHREPGNVTGKGEPSESKATTYYKTREAEFKKESTGRTVIPRYQYDTCLTCIEALQSRPRIREMIASSNHEVTVEGEIEGIEFKGRIDALLPSVILDLKTTSTVDHRKFGRRFFDLGYDFKLSIYRELVRQSTVSVRQVKVIVQEVDGDFDNVVMPVPEEVLDNAFSNVMRTVTRYKRCMETGYWPGVDDGQDEVDLFVPDYVLHQDLDWTELPEGETEEAEAYF